MAVGFVTVAIIWNDVSLCGTAEKNGCGRVGEMECILQYHGSLLLHINYSLPSSESFYNFRSPWQFLDWTTHRIFYFVFLVFLHWKYGQPTAGSQSVEGTKLSVKWHGDNRGVLQGRMSCLLNKCFCIVSECSQMRLHAARAYTWIS